MYTFVLEHTIERPMKQLRPLPVSLKQQLFVERKVAIVMSI